MRPSRDETLSLVDVRYASCDFSGQEVPKPNIAHRPTERNRSMSLRRTKKWRHFWFAKWGDSMCDMHLVIFLAKELQSLISHTPSGEGARGGHGLVVCSNERWGVKYHPAESVDVRYASCDFSSLPLPNEDLDGRTNVSECVSRESTFRIREYFIWATDH
jgi:hypothetical protein